MEKQETKYVLKEINNDFFVTHYPQLGLTDNINFARTFTISEARIQLETYENSLDVELSAQLLNQYYTPLNS